jgi:hypothetical protein
MTTTSYAGRKSSTGREIRGYFDDVELEVEVFIGKTSWTWGTAMRRTVSPPLYVDIAIVQGLWINQRTYSALSVFALTGGFEPVSITDSRYPGPAEQRAGLGSRVVSGALNPSRASAAQAVAY